MDSVKNIFGLLMLATVLAFAGCGGGKGSSTSPPTDVKVAVGDTSATVTWTPESGKNYWVWGAQGPDVSTEN